MHDTHDTPIKRLASIMDKGYRKTMAKIQKEIWIILEEYDARLKKLEEGGA